MRQYNISNITKEAKGKCHYSTSRFRARVPGHLHWPELQICYCIQIEWFKDICNYPVHNFKPFFVTPLPLGGPKIWPKGSFWHVSILSPREKSKQNQSKNVISDDITSFRQLVSIPVDAQKKSTQYSNSKLSKNGVKIKFSAHRFFRLFFSQSWMSGHLFFQSSLCFNIKHFFFYQSMDNNLKNICLHFHVIELILSWEIAYFLERINLRTPLKLFLTHT